MISQDSINGEKAEVSQDLAAAQRESVFRLKPRWLAVASATAATARIQSTMATVY
jgi:hypothetical protein